MIIDSDTIVSITEANQNFSKIARMVDQYGSVTIMKNNTPRYILIDFNEVEKEQNVSDEDVLSSSEKFIHKNKKIYESLTNK